MSGIKSFVSANGNVNFSDISGQLIVGDNNIQKQELSSTDMNELIESLIQFQERISSLAISKENLDLINDDLIIAIGETKKENLKISMIKEKFESAINTIKRTGGFIDTVLNWEWTEKIIKLLGIAGFTLLI